MGITLQHAILMIKEVKAHPLPKTVHLIGRQTVYLDAPALSGLLSALNFTTQHAVIDVDRRTGGAQASGRDYVTDETFFRMLGATDFRCIDISPYEGADLILDLNQPIPDEYEGIADFIFGGSVCDNVFDPAMYIRNISRMLKAGGRYISQEIASNHYHPYVILPPSWHFDYFVINQFNGVQVLVFDILDSWNVYGLDVDPSHTILSNFTAASDHTLGVWIVAEKGLNSTWHRSPTQDQYRSQAEWAEYRTSLRRIRERARPFPSFRVPAVESDLESHPPRWVPHYRYLGRFDLMQDPPWPSITRARDQTTSLLARWHAEGKRRIAIWGAAGFAEDLFTMTPLGETPIALVVDSNVELHGTLWHGCGIEGPEALARVKPDAVLVASVTFHDEIAHALDGMAALLGFEVGRIL